MSTSCILMRQAEILEPDSNYRTFHQLSQNHMVVSWKRVMKEEGLRAQCPNPLFYQPVLSWWVVRWKRVRKEAGLSEETLYSTSQHGTTLLFSWKTCEERSGAQNSVLNPLFHQSTRNNTVGQLENL